MSALSLFMQQGSWNLLGCCCLFAVLFRGFSFFPSVILGLCMGWLFFFSSNCDLPHYFLLTFLRCLLMFSYLLSELRIGWYPSRKACGFLVWTTIILFLCPKEAPSWWLAFFFFFLPLIDFKDCGGLEFKKKNPLFAFDIYFTRLFGKLKYCWKPF